MSVFTDSKHLGSRLAVTAALAGSVLFGSIAPVLAEQRAAPSFDKSRLDAAAVDYSQYRRWRHNNAGRNAAIAGAVGLGILGAAAAASAASRPYGGYGYYEPGYVYDDPVYYRPAPRYYEPAPRYYVAPGYGYRTYTRDPAGGTN